MDDLSKLLPHLLAGIGIRISKALFRREEEYEMDLWVVKYEPSVQDRGFFGRVRGPGSGHWRRFGLSARDAKILTHPLPTP
jgi:hypothetical protein